MDSKVFDDDLGGLYDFDSGAGAFGERAFGQRAFDYDDDDDRFLDGSDLPENDVFVQDDEGIQGEMPLDPRDLRIARKIETARIAQANRDAASLEKRKLAAKLRIEPIQHLDHVHSSRSNINSCMVCAMNVKAFYEQRGSDIDFAMVDSRWPIHICKHLKPNARCASCDGVSLCIHNKERFRCPTCGNAMCRDPAHEIYRKGKPLRKTACKGCKDAKGPKSVFEAAGGKGKKHSMKRRKHSIKGKKKHSMKRRKHSIKRKN
jgi:hypothetical protein